MQEAIYMCSCIVSSEVSEMMKEEFENLIGKEISDAEWNVVETVYMYYSDKITAQDIATIYKIDKLIIFDMFQRAKRIKELLEERDELLKKVAKIEDQLKVLGYF